MSIRKSSQKGDTLIEVIVAFAVFASLAVGASAIMSRGVTSAQEALETTLVRQQMDGQAQTLRFLYQEYIASANNPEAATFAEIVGSLTVADDASEFGGAGCTTTIPGSNAFALDPRGPVYDASNTSTDGIVTSPQLIPITGSPVAHPGLAKVLDEPRSYGMWIEAVRDEDSSTSFIDFHIRSCWESLSGNVPRTLGTIVRLYVPTT